MSGKEELASLRQGIDALDVQLVSLFEQRMRVSEQIAQVKAAANIAVVDRDRERKVLEAAMGRVDADNRAQTAAFMRTLMALSKFRQHEKLALADPIDFPAPVPAASGQAKAAFQGVPGAWGEQAARKLFDGAELSGCDDFGDVFQAVKAGKADWGVLPIENSQTGAIGEVYDLLRRNACYIVGEIWISIAQCLLAKPGAALSDIREVYSHPQGFQQCRRFLKNRPWDLTACRNTAYAAQLVAGTDDLRHAAIGSRRAAQVHGLTVLEPDIVDDATNRTRFIAIAARPVYDETATTTSITFSTAHVSGALCAVLQSFMLAGINLTRIESRPAAADKYRFFADLQANILSETARDALRQASMHCEYFEVLGCYPTRSEKK